MPYIANDYKKMNSFVYKPFSYLIIKNIPGNCFLEQTKRKHHFPKTKRNIIEIFKSKCQ